MCHYELEINRLPLLQHFCSYINVQEEETVSSTMEVGMHDYNHPHSGRHPGLAERNNKFRSVGAQLGDDAKAVETSDLTGLITDELEACVWTIRGLGNETERYHITWRLVQWDLLKQNRYQSLKWAGIEFMIWAHALDFFTQGSHRLAEWTQMFRLNMSNAFWSLCCI